MRAVRFAWIALFAVASLGCAHTYTDQRIQSGGALTADDSVYVRTPPPARFGDRTYAESGAQVADALAAALRGRVERVEVSHAPEGHEAALESARTARCEYLLHPTIDHWEDRATEWSGKSDLVTLRIGLYRAEDGELLDAMKLEAKSRWATLGGDHPQELLPQLMANYVDALR